jgi:hypothetical protein
VSSGGSGGYSSHGRLGNGALISFSRNDRLDLKTTAFSWTGEAAGRLTDFWHEDWASFLSSGSYRVLVLNRGAHWVEDALLLQELRETLTALRSSFPELLLIFRATPPGVLNCESYTAPLAGQQTGSSSSSSSSS